MGGDCLDFPAKLKAIRVDEALTQTEFCQVLDLSLSSQKKYEAGIIEVGISPLLKIVNHPRFMKYTLWLMTGRDAPLCGQVTPAAYRAPVSDELLSLPAKLNAVRVKEGLSLTDMATVLDFKLSDYKLAELERNPELSAAVLLRVTGHPRFKKYSLWLMTGEIALEAGQVSPV